MDPVLKQEYDRLISIRNNQIPPNGTLKGECTEFCSYFETIERRLRNDISVFEKVKMVKKYVRSAAGRGKALPTDIRPLSVLLDCFNHLMNILEEYCISNDERKNSPMDSSVENSSLKNHTRIQKFNDQIKQEKRNISDENKSFQHPYSSRWCSNTSSLFDLYKFIEDRLRAIRLDISIQELFCDTTINLLERICNFYIIFNFLLHENPRFEEHLNHEQIKKIIITLKQFYKRKRQFVLTFEEQKFYKFDILSSIGESTSELKENILMDRDKIFSSNLQRSTTHDPDIISSVYKKEDSRTCDISDSHASYSNELFFERYPELSNARRLVIEIFRGNHLLFYEYFKTVDFLTKCFLTTLLKRILKSSSNMFKLSFYERIDADLILNWHHIKDPSFFISEGIHLENGQFHFRSRPFNPIELKYKILPHLDFKLPSNLKMAINLNQKDIHINDIIIYQYILQLINKFQISLPVSKKEKSTKQKSKKMAESCHEQINYHHKKHKMEIRHTLDGIMVDLYDEYIRRLAALQLMKLFFKEKEDLILKWSKNSTTRATDPAFALVIEKTVSAAMLSERIKKKYPTIKKFHYNKELTFKDLLTYKCAIFIVNNEMRKKLDCKFFMLNRKFITSTEKNIDFTDFLENSRKIHSISLKHVLKNKSYDQSLKIMCNLLANRRNPYLQQTFAGFTQTGEYNDVTVFYFDEKELK